MFTHLCIEYGAENPITLKFKLRDNSVVPKWIKKVQLAQLNYSIDDPARFYGFGNKDQQITDALCRINSCIDTINQHRPIIDRRLTSVDDSDTLNYLHHIFEVYHGLLDQQVHEFYITAPDDVKRALSDLNICVHRCEAVARGNIQRHVVTYFGLPKTDVLDEADYQLFDDVYTAGTVYLNYVEIGKTLEELAVDNDAYIFDEAFKPFRHYSADFVVFLANSNLKRVTNKRLLTEEYYQKNEQFFIERGYHREHPHLKSGRIPLADLDTKIDNLVELLSTKQFVNSVYFE
jgi:hypothetical protein